MADLESKLIVRAAVTAASEHDSQALDPLIEAGDPATWADIQGGRGLPPDDCRREYGPFTSHTGVIRGGFGVYFGTGGG